MLLADLPAAAAGPADRVPMTSLESLPLDGIRVLDLSGPVGSYGGRLLADAGADVVKVELPAGDELRRQGPYAGRRSDPERSLTFAYYHANKRGIVLDYRRAEALGVLAELGANADVVLLTPPVAGFDLKTRELSCLNFAISAAYCCCGSFGYSAAALTESVLYNCALSLVSFRAIFCRYFVVCRVSCWFRLAV